MNVDGVINMIDFEFVALSAEVAVELVIKGCR